MNFSSPFFLLLASLALGMLPLCAGVASSYLKVSIVLGMIRSGLGAQQVPGTLVTMSLSVAITLAVMAPVLSRSAAAVGSLDAQRLGKSSPHEVFEQLAPAITPWREFMQKHCGERELEVMNSAMQTTDSAPTGERQIELRALIPAFVLSELKQGFAMGFVVLLPFLVIDLVVANLLVGMGMMMVSPVMVSLPLKLLLFVLSDGWLLLCRGLIESYG